MRPKKIILLLDDQPIRRQVRRFVFETHGYRVLSGPRFPRNPGLRLSDLLCRADLAVVDTARREVSTQLRLMFSDIPILHIGDAAEASAAANVWLTRAQAPEEKTAELLECVHILARRKRGPRKGLKKPSASVPYAEVFGKGGIWTKTRSSRSCGAPTIA